LTGYISKALALCGQHQSQAATQAFDLAFAFTEDSKTIHLLLLIKARQSFLPSSLLHHCSQAIALFNANQHADAILRVQELAAARPDADTLACRIVEVNIMHSLNHRFVPSH